MTPSARVQAAIDLLDEILEAAKRGGAAADTLIARYFATRRYAGSKDRRAVRELAYAAIRLCGEPPASGRAAMLAVAARDPALAALFTGEGHAPARIMPDEPAAAEGVAPEWLRAALAASGLADAELAALVERAPLDIRINRLADVAVAIPDAEPIPGLPDALRLPSGVNVEALPEWAAGAIEVQDAGSQIVTLAAQAAPGQRIVDLCAGAGGKTLALVVAMMNDGAILASDSDRGRLSRLSPRATRAGASIVTTRLLDPGREAEALADWAGEADCVLIDAPCSGTGTWRRNPEARWRLTPDRLARLVETQARLLDVGAALVKPGGALVHIVCSLLDAEGAGQVARFLGGHPGWRAEPLALPAGRAHGDGVRLTPAHDGTDGFFVARLQAPC
ncbi:RsmB/NOP family class I SAM-dependent RNA methyltransferase [Sphingomonas populi]|uniref:RsmB/NOP family class I SAM-dependent RNA methyltransferase n=1 Tax=Sphingomonas populi TaxID=2484750 RepID=A0A4Q6Y222_9SPHN|nr:RsmB/NOP family class I SAM-dependent RNA methyltransferase [Sphingomonas populi]RZF63096.1 RsmB/NOP family class I SAM-dependent RNA methyltransferase [Sphingomonas populi]